MSDAIDEIMAATYQALVDVGYAGLSISKIADNFDGSQSLIYYHYEDKDELLVEFLSYLLAELDTELDSIASEEPAVRIRSILDLLLPDSKDEEAFAFQQALLEIRVQTPHHEPYAEHFRELDATLFERFRETIVAGETEGTFAIDDPDQTADQLVTAVYGVHYRHLPVADTAAIRRTRERLENQIAEYEADK
jgi:AcrR family transcriptional regulator